MTRLPWDEFLLAGCLILAAGGAWAWQRTIRRSDTPPLPPEPVHDLSERFPMPQSLEGSPDVPAGFLQEWLHANPFSPLRSATPLDPATPPGATGAAGQPEPPAQFVYKGRLLMGRTQRAILEETNSKKTFFLQVSQEIKGFKVLEITDTRVILANLNTHEEITVPLASNVKPPAPRGGASPPANPIQPSQTPR